MYGIPSGLTGGLDVDPLNFFQMKMERCQGLPSWSPPSDHCVFLPLLISGTLTPDRAGWTPGPTAERSGLSSPRTSPSSQSTCYWKQPDAAGGEGVDKTR